MKPEAVPCNLLDADPQQPRKQMDSAETERLAHSIRDVGLLQPIIVFRSNDRFVIVDGHRRAAALTLLKREKAMALVLAERPSADRLLVTQLIANGQRVDLCLADQAAAFQRLKDAQKCTNTELATLLHTSKSRVTMLLSILRLPSEGQQLVNDGTVPLSTAYAISRVDDQQKQEHMLAEAANGTLKRDAAAARVARKTSRPSHRTVFRIRDNEIVFCGSEEPTPADCVLILQQLLKACRSAVKSGLSIRTLESMMADSRASSDK